MTDRADCGAAGNGPSGELDAVTPFARTLSAHGLSLVRGDVGALQVNTGFLCDRSCRHCHLEAGPGRREVMSRETMTAVIDFARRFRFATVDITGGAPELVPDLPYLLDGVSGLARRVVLRSNLSALAGPGREELLPLCVARRVVIVASFPSTDLAQVDAQRGAGAGDIAVAALRELNALGYGAPGSGLELDLVSNPVDASLPAEQSRVEAGFRRDLLRNWGISFTSLYTFGNVPLGRFGKRLAETGGYGRYLRTLEAAFNPRTVAGLMCRTQLSVSWDGCLYDCDFNLAAGEPMEGRRTHVSETERLPPPGTPVATGDYCYACTTGAGFT